MENNTAKIDNPIITKGSVGRAIQENNIDATKKYEVKKDDSKRIVTGNKTGFFIASGWKLVGEHKPKAKK
jgi:hypothetical protein